MSEDGGDKHLGILASITAAIEATHTEIRSVQIQNDGETHDAQVQLAIPLNGVNGLDRTSIATGRTDIVENTLQFELALEIDSVDHSSPSTPQTVADDQDGTSGPTDRSGDRIDQSDTQPPPADKTDDDDRDSGRETTEATPEVVTESDNTVADPRTEEATEFEDQEDRPQYQDPERLAAVYDETATFEEMRDELGVDVTAQTVRKYMIKHGIHEPEPRPDRLLETIRASELELMNSEYDDQPEETDPSTGPDTE